MKEIAGVRTDVWITLLSADGVTSRLRRITRKQICFLLRARTPHHVLRWRTGDALASAGEMLAHSAAPPSGRARMRHGVAGIA